jgi:hypothetical protein
MGKGTETISEVTDDLTSGVFDADLLAELSSLSGGNDLDRLEQNLQRAKAGLSSNLADSASESAAIPLSQDAEGDPLPLAAPSASTQLAQAIANKTGSSRLERAVQEVRADSARFGTPASQSFQPSAESEAVSRTSARLSARHELNAGGVDNAENAGKAQSESFHFEPAGSDVIASDLLRRALDDVAPAPLPAESQGFAQSQQEQALANGGHQTHARTSALAGSAGMHSDHQTTTALPADFTPTPEQIIGWLEHPEVRQAIFAMIAQEALASRSPLGRATGLRT